MYAVLDIETTGGKFNEEGITEIAIYRFDGQNITDEFISLVNPERPIQEYVAKLTGINNKMLRNAPKFHEVAKRIIEITDGCVLVAHNASFDYRMLQIEFKRLGFDYKKDSICTVDVSQLLLPEEPTYKLGKLAKNLGIPLSNRHRASGDALATVQLFKLLLTKDQDKKIIKKSVQHHDNRDTKEKLKAFIDKTPAEQGVFYLMDTKKDVIYMGRGKNMKSELNRLFLKTTKRASKIQKNASSIRFEKTGNELFTRLKYFLELENLAPKYNFKKVFKPNGTHFNNDSFLLIEQGREVEEHAIILVQNQKLTKFGYTNLAYQENSLPILENVLAEVTNTNLANSILKNYLQQKTPLKLVRL
ncbi:MAG: DNA polymerase III subunit epsilon [Flavobacteriaceae bacterium]|nr:DNA polymerase III subunit epsilon [Flavobacteriaceae bacterium]